MDKISVVVPVYNVEKYLEKCLNSIINQTYKNIEIIVVDDGSTDSCGQLCDEYAIMDKRIIVIHKKNGGLSDARNVGIDNATGKFICFIDSDDYVESNMIEKLYSVCKETNSDICCCGKFIENTSNTKISNSKDFFICSSEEALERMLTINDIETSAWDKIYKTSLFKNNDIKYPVNEIYEDMSTTYKVIDKAEKICHIPIPLYHYVIRNDSISHSPFYRKQLQLITNSQIIKEFIYSKYPKLNEAAEYFYYLQLITILQKIKYSSNFNDNKDIYEKLNNDFKESFFKILKNKYMSFFKKNMIILQYLNQYRLLKFLKKALKH